MPTTPARHPQPLAPSPTLTQRPAPLPCPECGEETEIDRGSPYSRCRSCGRAFRTLPTEFDELAKSTFARVLEAERRPAPTASYFPGCLACDDLGAVAEGYDPNTGQSWSSPGAAVRRSESTSRCGDAYEHPTCIGCGELIERGDLALDRIYCGRWFGLHARLECLESSMTHGYEHVDADEIAALAMRVVHALLRAEREASRDAD